MKSTLTTRVIQLTASARQLAASVSAPTLALSVRASVIAVQAVIGRFLKIIDLFDSFGVVDTARVQLHKNLRESLGLLSQVSRYLGKARSDDAQISDQLYRSAVKSLKDSAAWLDVEQRSFAKVLTDTAALLDAHRYEMARPLSDAARVADRPALSVYRPATDAAQILSETTRQLGKHLSDAAALLDQTQHALQKRLFDVITVTDDLDGAASLEDDQEMTFIKTRTEQVALSDDFYRTVQFVRAFVDPGFLSDFVRQDVGKALSDDAALFETTALTSEKPLSDSLSLDESAQYLFERPVTDAAHVVDAAVQSFGKDVQDDAGFIDTAWKGFGGALADGTLFSDSTSFALTYVLNHVVNTADDHEIQFAKNHADAVVISDLFSRQVEFRRSAEDPLSLTDDNNIKQCGKALSEFPRFEDQVARAAQRTASDDALISDLRVLTPGKTRTEQATLTDAGSLRSQGYCDFSYFAEDYVGASRTF